MTSASDFLTKLHSLLAEHFDLDELRTLCFDLGLDYDELRGEVKSAKARELITVMLRQNRLAELATTLQSLRPDVDWPNVEALSPEARLAWTTATEMQSAADYLVALRDYCANLPYLTLHDIRPPKTLDEVYVSLKARPQPRKKDPQGLQDLEGLRERSEPLSISDVMRKRAQPHVLILGEPGAGKSTLLRQLAEHAWDAPDKIGLDAPHLPILVPLRRLASAEGALEERLNRALTAELTLTQALPQGFFANWPKQTGANWLILLDALDEVPAEQRAPLMQWLKGLLGRVGQSRIVLTSRPAGYSPGKPDGHELDEKLFGHYDLLLFTSDQTSEFVHKWFEDGQGTGSAEQFLKELERVRAGALSGTPLLLTIAAKVYLEKGTLPERRSGLYGQFVDIWLSEAEQRGLRAEVGDPVCDVAQFALAHLALAMTEHPRQTEASLIKMAADYLREAVPLTSERAEVVGERFLKVMARRSGVFTRRGDAYDFIHPTMREYLAADAVVRECVSTAFQIVEPESLGRQKRWWSVLARVLNWIKYRLEIERIWQRVVSRWADRNWREVALFVLGILSDVDRDVTPLVHHVWRKREQGFHSVLSDIWQKSGGGWYVSDTTLTNQVADQDLTNLVQYLWRKCELGFHSVLSDMWQKSEERLYFAGTALGEQVKVDTRLSNNLVDKLFARVKSEKSLPLSNAISILGELRSYPHIGDRLWALANEMASPDERECVAEALGKLGRVDEAVPILLTVARGEWAYSYARERAAEALGKLRRADEATQAWLALARDERAYPDVREHAAEALGKLGHADGAAFILLALARDEGVREGVRADAAEALGKLGRADEAASILLALARDEGISEGVREDAAEALGKSGRADEAASILLALARDKRANPDVRERATKALGELGRADNLLMLLHDEMVVYSVRSNAMRVLGKLGRADDLLALARDKKVDEDTREDAAKALGQLGWVDEATQAWLALARDGRIHPYRRERAAEALGKFGWADEAIPILLALARDERASSDERERVAEALGKLGRVDEAVPILLIVARDEWASSYARERAAEALSKFGRADEAIPILLALACNEWVSEHVREDAVEALGKLGRTDEAASILIAITHDKFVDDLGRVRAAKALGKLGWANKAAPILLALVRDKDIDDWARVAAAEALGQLGRADKATSILLALARDEKVWESVRERAAEALIELGRADDLQALARDGKVDWWVRQKVIEKLDKLFDTHVLPEL